MQLDKEIRESIGIPKDAYLVGHVGRFHYAKNHEFLLAIFRDVLRQYDAQKGKKPLLLMLGEGPRMEEMKTLAHDYGVSQDVIFAGNHSDVYRYYQGMDIFLYPRIP